MSTELGTCWACEEAPATRRCLRCGVCFCAACDDGEDCTAGLPTQEETICPEDVWGTAEEFEAAEDAQREKERQ